MNFSLAGPGPVIASKLTRVQTPQIASRRLFGVQLAVSGMRTEITTAQDILVSRDQRNGGVDDGTVDSDARIGTRSD